MSEKPEPLDLKGIVQGGKEMKPKPKHIKLELTKRCKKQIEESLDKGEQMLVGVIVINAPKLAKEMKKMQAKRKQRKPKSGKDR